MCCHHVGKFSQKIWLRPFLFSRHHGANLRERKKFASLRSSAYLRCARRVSPCVPLLCPSPLLLEASFLGWKGQPGSRLIRFAAGPIGQSRRPTDHIGAIRFSPARGSSSAATEYTSIFLSRRISELGESIFRGACVPYTLALPARRLSRQKFSPALFRTLSSFLVQPSVLPGELRQRRR